MVSIVLLSSSCVTSYKYSYEEDNLPVFTGDFRPSDVSNNSEGKEEIKVVSFNIEFSQNIDEAISLLQNDILHSADVILLQEMDEKATHKLADQLDMSYVYYPAIYHPKYEKNVGNAILSRWEIKNSKKIKLPCPSTYPSLLKGKNYIFRKIATIAEINVRGSLITFASTHAAAFNTTNNRREFARALAHNFDLEDSEYVVVGGDFNSLGDADIQATVGPFEDLEFLWASKDLGMTISVKKPILKPVPKAAFQLDHLFVKGLIVKEVGKVYQKGVSDHLPIWATLKVEKHYK